MPTHVKLFVIALIVLAGIAIAHKVVSAPELTPHAEAFDDTVLQPKKYDVPEGSFDRLGTSLVSTRVFYGNTDHLFEKIAWCESKNDPKAKNAYSTASGRFQFLNSSWEYYGKQYWGDKFYQKNVFDYDDNTALAWYVYMKNGTSDWEESRPCWGK